jgi:ABC-2 type transport system permease protein
MSAFSPSRFWAMVMKEFVQMRRDRLTFGMMVGIPVLQLVLFGYAINSDPKHLPTGVVLADHGPFGRTLLHADPGASGPAIAAARQVFQVAVERDLKGPLAPLQPGEPAIDLRIHARYNPEAVTQYNIVPGLMGVVLTMTMVMITGLAITRERERGTMENLLSMPTRPIEVMAGKILPFIFVGGVQAALIFVAGRALFHVPMMGEFAPLVAATLLFITANLAMGITFSTVATNQLQAVQMSFFFFLPSLLLSGFMFPFRGMPLWAQAVGEVFPLTHFLRIVRGIMLKGNGFPEISRELWPIALFALVVLTVGVKRYRRTLD